MPCKPCEMGAFGQAGGEKYQQAVADRNYFEEIVNIMKNSTSWKLTESFGKSNKCKKTSLTK